LFDNIILDYATVSAVVAAFVSVVGNAFNIQAKYRALLAIIVGVVMVALPDWLMQKSVTALLIGLTASGVYTQVKKRDYNQGTTNSPTVVAPSSISGPTTNAPSDPALTQATNTVIQNQNKTRIKGLHDV
jgi:hypothetical protein